MSLADKVALNVREAAKAMSVSETTLRSAIRRGELRVMRMAGRDDTRGKLLISVKALEEYRDLLEADQVRLHELDDERQALNRRLIRNGRINKAEERQFTLQRSS